MTRTCAVCATSNQSGTWDCFSPGFVVDCTLHFVPLERVGSSYFLCCCAKTRYVFLDHLLVFTNYFVVIEGLPGRKPSRLNP